MCGSGFQVPLAVVVTVECSISFSLCEFLVCFCCCCCYCCRFPNSLLVFVTCRKCGILLLFCSHKWHKLAQAYSLCIFIRTLNLVACVCVCAFFILFYFIFIFHRKCDLLVELLMFCCCC